ncbi:hypothetical protein [Bdellovibrio sp. HCB2-146]|uniref:hypothetical protein n=1 Tax=Bdellovibrio sp. HCB2-146 TaxID=3394362 RepID=UPI0039BCAF55
MKLLALALPFLLTTTLASACPLGEKEDVLTIQRVMRNFGRFILAAEMVTLKANNPNEKVQDKEFTEAAAKLEVAISCADAVIANPSGRLLPDNALDLEGEALADYIDSLVYFMDEFKTSLTEFRDLLTLTASQKVEERDYSALTAKTEEIDKLVLRAHKRL